MKQPDVHETLIKQDVMDSCAVSDKSESIGAMVARNPGYANIFSKYGIDFCCGGNKSFEDVCKEKNLTEEVIRAELGSITEPKASLNNYNNWSPDFLADYIYNQHHTYYYTERPLIKELMDKVVTHHGKNFPQLITLAKLADKLMSELNNHFKKEEEIVFPFIKQLVQTVKTGDVDKLDNKISLKAVLQSMESDHEGAGDLLKEIRLATDNFQPPSQACNSFRYLYNKLHFLEEDLHQHIHLENNVLFPKALQLEKSASSISSAL